MKILLVHVFNDRVTGILANAPGNIAHARVLEKLGADVIKYDFRIRAEALGSNAARDRELIEICHKEQPDLTIFCKCNEIHANVVAECNNVGKTCLWYMDPVNSNYNVALKEKLALVTFACFALWEPYAMSKEVWGKKIHLVEEGYNEYVDKPRPDIEPEFDISFIGNLHGERAEYWDYLRKHKPMLKYHNFTQAFHGQHSVAVAKSRINLNFTNGGTSDRTYKVLAARGFLLTQPWPHMEDNFSPGKHFGVFASKEELVSMVDSFLYSTGRMQLLADQGYEAVRQYNRLNWAKKILGIFSMSQKGAV